MREAVALRDAHQITRRRERRFPSPQHDRRLRDVDPRICSLDSLDEGWVEMRVPLPRRWVDEKRANLRLRAVLYAREERKRLRSVGRRRPMAFSSRFFKFLLRSGRLLFTFFTREHRRRPRHGREVLLFLPPRLRRAAPSGSAVDVHPRRREKLGVAAHLRGAPHRRRRVWFFCAEVVRRHERQRRHVHHAERHPRVLAPGVRVRVSLVRSRRHLRAIVFRRRTFVVSHVQRVSPRDVHHLDVC